MKTSADARPPPTAEELQQQARVWLRLLTSTEVKEVDAEGFQRWLRTSPSHQAAFVQAKRRWEALKPMGMEFLRADPEAATYHRRAMRGPVASRRAFLGAAVSAAAVAGIAVVHPPGGLWLAPAEWGADERTRIGEQRAVTLASRVQVTLNTQTSIRRHATDDEMAGIDLLNGEAAIDLPVAGQRFVVMAGTGCSVAESGRFEVRYLAGRACVSCLEGSVRVEHPAGVRRLQARQQTLYGIDAVGGIANVEPDTVSAWRQGALVFNEARLSEVLDEINRYRPGQVVLMKSAARDYRISGRFLIASLDSALSQIQGMFDLHGRSLPAGLYILS
ncbi:FecR family protein [Variovorax boronicumulans]